MDGSLTDAVTGQQVDLVDLLADLRDGRRFRAHRCGTGANCTLEVLADVLAIAPEFTRAPFDVTIARVAGGTRAEAPSNGHLRAPRDRS